MEALCLRHQRTVPSAGVMGKGCRKRRMGKTPSLISNDHLSACTQVAIAFMSKPTKRVVQGPRPGGKPQVFCSTRKLSCSKTQDQWGHIWFCAMFSQNQRGTSAHWVSTDGAATASFRSRNRKKHLRRGRMWRGGFTHATGASARQEGLCRGRLARASSFKVMPFHLVKWEHSDSRGVSYKTASTNKQRCLQIFTDDVMSF